MQHLESCLLIAEADRVLSHPVIFLSAFFHWMYKMNTATIQIRLSFIAGLFIGIVVER